MWREGGQDAWEGGHTSQQRETIRGTMGNTSGRRPTKGNKKGYNARQGETRPSARRTHLPTRGVKKGYNGRHRETKPSERQTHHPTKGNKKGYNGQWETKGNKKEGVQWETI